ncbi:MAG: hypothetical protein R3A50_13990 [Saprospiraceae bacterium]
MKLSFVLFLIVSVFMIGPLACHKEKTTIINCTIIDKLSGLPVDSATVGFAEHFDNNKIRYVFKDTNTAGEVSFSSDFVLTVFDIYKKGYNYKDSGSGFPPITQGETNEVMLNLTPKDGFLKLQLENSIGPPDSLYVVIYSPIQHAESPITAGRIINDWFIFQDSLKVIDIPTVAEEQLELYWGGYPLLNPLSSAPFHGSVYVGKTDTASFTISF